MQFSVTRTTVGILFFAAAAACAPETMDAASRATALRAAMTNIPASPSAADSGVAAVAVPVSSGLAGAASAPLLLPAPIVMTGTAAVGRGEAGAAAMSDCGAIRQKADSKPGPVDIVWIIDGSGSMVDEQAAVKQNIASFAAAIGRAGIDHHVV